MATPSWLRRLSESEDGSSRRFQIPSVSLYSSTSSLASQASLPRHSSVFNENISERRCSVGQESVGGTSEISEKFKSKTVGRRRNGGIQTGFTGLNKGYISGSSTISSRYNSADLDSEVSSVHVTPGASHVQFRPAQYPSGHMKDFEKSRSSDRHEANDSWSYIDSEGYARLPPSVHTSVSYGEFEGSSISSGSYAQRGRKNNSDTPGAFDRTEEKRAKRHDRQCDNSRTQPGYNPYNELSEFGGTSRTCENRENKTKNRNYSSDKDKSDRYSKFPRRSSRAIEDRVSDVSHKRCDSKLSVAESDLSSSSKEKNKRTPERGSTTSLDSKTQKVPSIGNVAVTVTNNIQYDPNDPFSFIQPVGLPFHKKVRKCLGPVMAVLLLLILAGALGAAIYFASALKDTQENQIDMLRANLAMKIRNIDHTENIEDISSNDFKDLSIDYCKHMDLFYTRSELGKTYRGCEVVSIKNSYINFTLFFVEEAATSSQIVEVLEASAKTVTGTSSQLAVGDKFALELDTVEVKMERKLEPETFNKKIINTQTTTANPQSGKDNVMGITSKKPTPGTKKQSPLPARTKATTPRSTGKKKPPTDKPVYSWDPCTEYEGMYFPHPTECDMFIQCTNGQKIDQRCTKGLLYHWKQLTCVSRFTRDVLCPDPSKAPPRPTTAATTSSATTSSLTPTPSTASTTTTTQKKVEFTTILSSTIKQFIPKGVILTAIAGKFAERPKYSANPCENKMDIQLYPHPGDCGMFIQCVNGKVQNMNCAKGLVFDPSNSACIFPTNNDLLCPDIRPCQEKDDGYFPHPFDCSKFIQCQFKKETVLSCQKDLVWSIKVNSCVHKTKSIVCPLDPKR